MALLHLGISSCPLGKNELPFKFRQVQSSRNRIIQTTKNHAFPLHYIVELAQEAAAADGPIELPSDLDQPQATPFQIGASVVLTGTIGVLLFRSIRRRFKQAKEQKVRSSGIESVKEQAQKSILEKIAKETSVETPPASIQQTVYGAILAGAIAFVTYQFTVAVETNFASRPITTTDYSIRNITVTVRTIISGMSYLATFIFAADAIGLTLYALQLAFNSPKEPEQVKPEDQDVPAKIETTISSSSEKQEQ